MTTHLPTLTEAIAAGDDAQIATVLAGIADAAGDLAAQASTPRDVREALLAVSETLDDFRR